MRKPIARSLEEARVRSTDELHLRAVGSWLGAELPHPYGCGCSEHVTPCPHDVRQYQKGFFDKCARCGSNWNPSWTAKP